MKGRGYVYRYDYANDIEREYGVCLVVGILFCLEIRNFGIRLVVVSHHYFFPREVVLVVLYYYYYYDPMNQKNRCRHPRCGIGIGSI
jgi:hypothetical protein